MRSYTTHPASRLIWLLPALCWILSAGAQERSNYIWPVKLQKDYNKTYPVGSEIISLQNRFGQLTIETWDKNEVKVEAHVTVGSQTNEYATQLLDKIEVKDDKKDGRISFSTIIGDMNMSGNNYNGGHEMKIDYIVHLPATAKLYAENSFGPVTIGDYSGESEFVVKYGNLTAGKLGNCRSVSVDYGKAIIEALSNSQFQFRYSRIDIAKMSGTIKGQFDYCNSVDLVVDNGVQQLELRNNYTSLYLVVPKDFSAEYDIATNNAKVTSKYISLGEEKSSNGQSVAFNSNRRYSGSFGKGGGTKINIRSSFGNVRFM